jgi:membrane-associated protease RseP (regulator of RpoE activity)
MKGIELNRKIFLLIFGLLFSFPWGKGPCFAQELGGVGIMLDVDPQDGKSLLIYSVSYKSPADKAKIRRGDHLLKVDGAEVTGMNLQEVAKKIAGPLGSTVTLTVQSPQSGTQDYILTRSAISKGPVVALPPPTTSSGTAPPSAAAPPTGVNLTPEEKALVKQKIMGLTTDEQREQMMNLLQALKNGKVTKEQFLKSLKMDY